MWPRVYGAPKRGLASREVREGKSPSRRASSKPPRRVFSTTDGAYRRFSCGPATAPHPRKPRHANQAKTALRPVPLAGARGAAPLELERRRSRGLSGPYLSQVLPSRQRLPQGDKSSGRVEAESATSRPPQTSERSGEVEDSQAHTSRRCSRGCAPRTRRRSRGLSRPYLSQVLPSRQRLPQGDKSSGRVEAESARSRPPQTSERSGEVEDSQARTSRRCSRGCALRTRRRSRGLSGPYLSQVLEGLRPSN
jgi:hypothetical protein